MDVTLHVYMFLGMTSGLTLVQARIGIGMFAVTSQLGLVGREATTVTRS